jgi:hypothetical protein
MKLDMPRKFKLAEAWNEYFTGTKYGILNQDVLVSGMVYASGHSNSWRIEAHRGEDSREIEIVVSDIPDLNKGLVELTRQVAKLKDDALPAGREFERISSLDLWAARSQKEGA